MLVWSVLRRTRPLRHCTSGYLTGGGVDSDWTQIGRFWWWWLVSGVGEIQSWAGYRAGLDSEVCEIGAGS